MQEKMAVGVEPVEPVEHGSSSALVNTSAHTETLVQYEPQEVTKQEVATGKTVSYGEEATAKASEEQKDSFELPPRLVLDSTPSSPTTSASVSNTSSATCCSSQEEEVPECADSKMHTNCKSGTSTLDYFASMVVCSFQSARVLGVSLISMETCLMSSYGTDVSTTRMYTYTYTCVCVFVHLRLTPCQYMHL
jgi:hypothetical protein